jgi:serine kinase of HPr protein (carbohydrate metabolism regulator)
MRKYEYIDSEKVQLTDLETYSYLQKLFLEEIKKVNLANKIFVKNFPLMILIKQILPEYLFIKNKYCLVFKELNWTESKQQNFFDKAIEKI